MSLVDEFQALGQDAHAAADVTADVTADANSERLVAVLAERDALLTQLALVLADQPAGERERAAAALTGATVSTAELITKVAERTDALRRELRELGRGERAHSAYVTQAVTTGHVNARR